MENIKYMIKDFSEEFVARYDNGSWVNALIVSALILLGSLIVHQIVFRLIKSFNKHDMFILRQTRLKFNKPSLFLLLFIAFDIILWSFVPQNILVKYIKHALNLMIIFNISWIVIRFIGLGKQIVLKKYDIAEKDNLKARRVYTQLKIIERILTFVVIVISLAIALMTFETIRQIGISLFASAGVAGIILGFAAQKMLGTFLAGFQIAITQPIRLDDAVIVENEWGWIEEITLTYVVVRIWDKRRLVLPTTYFIEKPFQNWTRTSSDILGTVFIYTDYEVPFDAIRDELTRLLEKSDYWDGKVNVLQVTDATEKTVEIRILVSASDSPTAWNLRVSIRESIISFLQKNYPESLPKSRVLLEEGKEIKSRSIPDEIMRKE